MLFAELADSSYKSIVDAVLFYNFNKQLMAMLVSFVDLEDA